MDIKRYESELISSNMYVITERGHAIVIDPFDHIEPIEGLVIDYILLTHEHYDHISGVNLWKSVTKANVLCSEKCAERIQNPRKNFARYFKEFCDLQTWIELDKIPAHNSEYYCSADETFKDKKEYEWQGHTIQLIEIPGHSLGSIMIIIDNEHVFSGDSIMENSEIELRMPGGSKKQWNEVGRQRIQKLPDGIHIYPGHFNDFVYKKEGED